MRLCFCDFTNAFANKNGKRCKIKGFVVRQTGFEPTTFGSGGQHSIQLSYWRIY